MSYVVTNAEGATLAVYEDKQDAARYALSVGGIVTEDDGTITESKSLEESAPIILAG